MFLTRVPNPIKPIADPRYDFSAAYAVLRDAVSAQAFPGSAFGISSGEKVILQDAIGNFTYEPQAATVQPDTIFDIASLTKVLGTTAMAMLLFQQRLLDLETPLGDLLPGFVIGRESSRWARQVTIRHLLAHSSGLPGYAALYRTCESPKEILRACLMLPIEAEPGSRSEYSDPGFILLGKALENLVGENLEVFLNREIFTPLELNHTGFCPPRELRLSIPPTELDDTLRLRIIQGEVQDENAFRMNGVSGHAGLFSNVPDLLRFACALTLPELLFELETIDFFSTRQAPAGSSRGLGWDTPSGKSSSGSRFSSRSIGHLGYSGCSLWIDRDRDLAIAMLTNRTWPHRESQLIRTVRPAFHDAVREQLV